jgi:hypothetical protein
LRKVIYGVPRRPRGGAPLTAPLAALAAPLPPVPLGDVAVGVPLAAPLGDGAVSVGAVAGAAAATVAAAA